MKSRLVLILAAVAVFCTSAPTQVPDGWYVFCSFQGVAGETGIFFAHPRTPGKLITVTGLTPDLAWVPSGRQGASCVMRRPRDGALIVGERAPAGHSVDLHILTLEGAQVRRSQLFSVGTGVNAGEIPQIALLPDGNILIAATDLSAGPLALIPTAQYNLQGVGILDPVSGLLTPVPISNATQLFNSVINGLAVSPDGKTCYIGTYVSATQGDIWALPLPQGGVATYLGQVPAGLSNLAIDLDGNLLIATLGSLPLVTNNLFKMDVATKTVTPITTASGPLNAVAVETVTGNYAAASANAGIPPRSLFWMTPTGQETLLLSPDKATISGVDINPNPEAFGVGSPGVNSYTWRMAPNPRGLPLLGSPFSLTLEASGPQQFLGIFHLATARLTAPLSLAGIKVHLDPVSLVGMGTILPATTMTINLPIPAEPSLAGLGLFLQAFILEGTALAASPGVEFTIM